MDLEHRKVLWKKLNLVRLYCQYRAENREVFSSVKGYEYLFQVISRELLYSSFQYSRSSHNDTKEVYKEVAKIVDAMGGLKENDLQMASESSVWGFMLILFDLLNSEYLKLQSMVLKIYRGMFEHCIDYLRTVEHIFIRPIVKNTLYVLAQRDSPRDIANEDLCNAMVILKAASINSIRASDFPRYVDVLYTVVMRCVSRFQELHDFRAQPSSISSSHEAYQEAASLSSNGSSSFQEDQDHGEVENNIHMISMALDQGLFLIYSLLTLPHGEKEPHIYESPKKQLQSLDIIKQIVLMVELILAGNKFFQSCHLGFGLKITVALYKEKGSLRQEMRKDEHVHVFRNFLGSKYVDEYGTEVKQFLEDIVHGEEASGDH
jgi:hypothetical protein